jgi:hypothetical protein
MMLRALVLVMVLICGCVSPERDAKRALAAGDRQLVGYMGVGAIVPGTPEYFEAKMYQPGVRFLPGVTDTSSRSTVDRAAKYATAYNRVILADGIHSTSPHGVALRLVMQQRQAEIDTIDQETATPKKVGRNDAWWFDTKFREYRVRRPFSPGFIDSRHMFEVLYVIDGTLHARWLVDTQRNTVKGGRVSPTTAPAPTQEEG